MTAIPESTFARRVPIASLLIDPRNARAHPDANRAAVRASLAEHGQVETVVVQLSTRRIIGGNCRVEELIELGTETVWVHEVDCDDATADRLALRLNRTAELAGWHTDILSEILAEQAANQVDLSDLGWGAPDLDDLPTWDGNVGGFREPTGEGVIEGVAADIGEIEDDEPAVPPVPRVPVTQPGEVVTLGRHVLHCGDCVEVMAGMEAESVDAIVTDPPYGIGLLGRAWDAAVPGDKWAAECLRVLKPGGHVIAFGATRTLHRLTCALEDTGFEIRDVLHWVQWQGMPASLNVSKAIDKRRDDRDQILQVTAWIKAARDAAGLSNADLDAPFGFAGMSGHWVSQKSQPAVPTLDQVPTLLEALGVAPEDVPEEIGDLLVELNGRKGQPGKAWFDREVIGRGPGSWSAGGEMLTGLHGAHDITAPATEEAKQWEGYGTGLRPVVEPAVLARKPMIGTVADNVIAHGTGALHIDATRFAPGDPMWPGPQDGEGSRWPANLIHCPKASTAERSDGVEEGAARHITVKPLHLMRWLVRLVSPPGARILEPFAGSGTTLLAAEREDFDCVAIEQDPGYCDIIRARFEGLDPEG